MSSEFSGPIASLRPSGIGRYFGAAFLIVWLAGWLVGEVFAVWIMGTILLALAGVSPARMAVDVSDLVTGGAAGFVILGLIVWLTLWTVGGVAALTELLRSLAGEDSISLDGTRVQLIRRAGPFRRRSAFERSAIRRIRLRPRDSALVLDTHEGNRILTQFGSAQERASIADWLKRRLVLPDEDATISAGRPPSTWEVTSDAGRMHLRKVRPRVRAARSAIAWLVTGAVSIGWFASLEAGRLADSLPALALTLVLAAGAAMSTWGCREWIVRSGELTSRQRFAVWHVERRFTGARLAVTHHTDSDNDSHYKLIVEDGDGRRVVHSEVHDGDEVVDLGRWLASHTGFPLTLA